ncbi:MAG TPA: hypothetical protein VK638_46525 [Edaphobacter sp.]|nr:hypothetical protein [Edaphobacter sp.]
MLTDQLELMQWFPSLTIREMQLLIAAARHRAEQLSDLSSPQALHILRSILRKVVICDSEAHIEVEQHTLRGELLGEGSVSQDPDTESGHILLTCPFTITRRGQEVRIVISAGLFNESRAVPSLLRAVARSRDWADQIVSGKARTVDDLVKYSGLTRPYIRRILRCAALSPQILEGILHGRHPVDLTVVGLTDNLSMDWNEQRHKVTVVS